MTKGLDMNLKHYFGALALIVGTAAAPAEALISKEKERQLSDSFCEKARAYGTQSWQTLLAFDAKNPVHRGVNLYLMNEMKRRETIGNMFRFLPEAHRSTMIEKEMSKYEAFWGLNDDQKRHHLLKEIGQHGQKETDVKRSAAACSPRI